MASIKFLSGMLFAPMIALSLAHAQNNPPVAGDDTASTFSGITKTLMVNSQILYNDSDPDGTPVYLDTFIYQAGNGIFENLGPNFLIKYTPDLYFYGMDTIRYVICDAGMPVLCDTGLIIFTVKYKMYEASACLDINNISARFNAGGSDFWNPYNPNAAFEVPKGSGKSTIFMADLWIGGYDGNDSLHVAAQTYKGFGADYWPGPIMDSAYYGYSQDSLWNRLWKVNKTDIDYHIANWNQPGYTAIDAIQSWPGNGDISKGQAAMLAPYYDRAGDQVYDAYDGDYPLIKGDQTVYFIRNDDRDVHGSGCEKMKLEIHGMAYAFDCTSDEALFNTVFVNYRIVNRSLNDYDSTRTGIVFDPDIGDYTDDYIECDVARNSYFGFNGNLYDGTGAPDHYGKFPPAQSVTFLAGPLLDADGADNPKGGCDAGVNGSGFGDGIPDNERFGMSNFLYFCNPGGGACLGVQGDPVTAQDYYNMLKSVWRDSTHARYGGNGHMVNCTSCEYANYMFPQYTDSCHLGTLGIQPADTVSWTDMNALNSPNDRRGVGAMGSFTFEAGDTLELDIAYVYGRDLVDSLTTYSSVRVMKEHIDSIRNYFERNYTPCGGVFSEIRGASKTQNALTLYPNPANAQLHFIPDNPSKTIRYGIYNTLGKMALQGEADSASGIDLRGLSPGLYVLRLNCSGRVYSKKFVKM